VFIGFVFIGFVFIGFVFIGFVFIGFVFIGFVRIVRLQAFLSLAVLSRLPGATCLVCVGQVMPAS